MRAKICECRKVYFLRPGFLILKDKDMLDRLDIAHMDSMECYPTFGNITGARSLTGDSKVRRLKLSRSDRTLQLVS